jgi:hypothetical protein
MTRNVMLYFECTNGGTEAFNLLSRDEQNEVLNLQERLIHLLAKSKSVNAQTRRRAIAEINTTQGMSSYLAQVMRCRRGEPPMPRAVREQLESDGQEVQP